MTCLFARAREGWRTEDGPLDTTLEKDHREKTILICIARTPIAPHRHHFTRRRQRSISIRYVKTFHRNRRSQHNADPHPAPRQIRRLNRSIPRVNDKTCPNSVCSPPWQFPHQDGLSFDRYHRDHIPRTPSSAPPASDKDRGRQPICGRICPHRFQYSSRSSNFRAAVICVCTRPARYRPSSELMCYPSAGIGLDSYTQLNRNLP